MRALVYSAIGLGVAGLLAYGVVLARSGSTTDVDVRVWQSTSDAQALYISARPDGGSWRTLGTIPLGEGAASEYETTANGRFRYSDITLAVPLDEAVQPGMVPQDVHDAALARIADLKEQLAARPTATPDPTATPTPSPTATAAPTTAPVATPTPTATAAPTASPVPTATATPSPAPRRMTRAQHQAEVEALGRLWRIAPSQCANPQHPVCVEWTRQRHAAFAHLLEPNVEFID